MANGNFGFRAENRFLELQCDVLAKIGTTLGAAATAASPAAAKEVTKPEEVTKDVAEILEDAGIKALRTSRAAHSRMSEAVVAGTLFLIGQHGVRLAAFLKFFFRIRIVGVPVGMVLHCEFAVGALDLDLSGRSGDTEDFVVIAFSVAGQNK